MQQLLIFYQPTNTSLYTLPFFGLVNVDNEESTHVMICTETVLLSQINRFLEDETLLLASDLLFITDLNQFYLISIYSFKKKLLTFFAGHLFETR